MECQRQKILKTNQTISKKTRNLYGQTVVCSMINGEIDKRMSLRFNH